RQGLEGGKDDSRKADPRGTGRPAAAWSRNLARTGEARRSRDPQTGTLPIGLHAAVTPPSQRRPPTLPPSLDEGPSRTRAVRRRVRHPRRVSAGVPASPLLDTPPRLGPRPATPRAP